LRDQGELRKYPIWVDYFGKKLMNPKVAVVRTSRKLARRLNWVGLFIEFGDHALPWAILAGYTRSGTTFLGRILSNILRARPVHEPLNPAANRRIHYFNARESLSTIKANVKYRHDILASFSQGFKGTRLTNTGSRLIYHGRIIKIVRGNHYLDYLSDLFEHCPFIIIMRNPCACIASRLKSGWPVPDHSHGFRDIEALLTDDQISTYLQGGSTVARLAVSWCLDNVMMLKNAKQSNFIFVHYENIVTNPEPELEKILKHINREDCIDRIGQELAIESMDSKKAEFLMGWKSALSEQDINEIRSVLKAFKLDHYYDFETGAPLGESPFSK
jgi:hypothetical protein